VLLDRVLIRGVHEARRALPIELARASETSRRAPRGHVLVMEEVCHGVCEHLRLIRIDQEAGVANDLRQCSAI
jgi:hypothetical protein